MRNDPRLLRREVRREIDRDRLRLGDAEGRLRPERLQASARPLRSLCQPPGAGEQSRAGAAQLAPCANRLAAGDGWRQCATSRSTCEGLRKLADDRVIFTGIVFGDGYWALQKHAGIFVFACEIGGVHPALIEAMAAQNARCTWTLRKTPRLQAMPRCAYSKNEADFAQKLQNLLENDAEREQWGLRARQRAQELFAWEAIANKYEDYSQASFRSVSLDIPDLSSRAQRGICSLLPARNSSRGQPHSHCQREQIPRPKTAS